ncbi:MAG: hypothetical protein ACFFC9_02870 [Promethearchaeota archaeon]
MSEAIEEIGNCEECGAEMNLAESWRVDEKYYYQKCFEKLSL